jgi:tetratricopeptide (TPR) repeat protein
MILLAATGFALLFESISKKYVKWIAAAAILLISVHPLRFMLENHPYEYIYYNELTGGLKGAYGNYETDYYYVSHAEASKWLIDYLEKKGAGQNVKIQAGYSIGWFFRKHPEIETSFFRYEERSMLDWDYAIVANRYISPYILKKRTWPPENTIHTVYAGGVPICAVLERKTKDDLKGYGALREGRNREAIEYFRKALQSDNDDEMIFYNFAAALYNDGQFQAADSALKKGLEINPDFELIHMYMGNIAVSKGDSEGAVKCYERVISINRKYFEAYVALARLIGQKDVMRARSLLRTCLKMNPRYREAIMALGDTYRESDPGIAEKYYNQANNINN